MRCGPNTEASGLDPEVLHWGELSLYTAGSIPRVQIQFGPAFWLLVCYIAVVGGGNILFVLILLDSFSVYRRQLAAMAVVGTIEFLLLAIFLTEHTTLVPDLNPWPHIQLITYNMVFVAAPLGWSYVRQSLFSLQVLDNQAVIENMADAVFVFDVNDNLRRVNAHGLGVLDRELLPDGAPARSVFADRQQLFDAYQKATRATPDTASQAYPTLDDAKAGDSVELHVCGERRWYNIRVTAIENSDEKRVGTVLVARDVTVRRRNREMLTERTAELERKTETLERQNERLDQFAGIVSHDLRNPLTVAQLRFELVQDDVPAEHADVVQRNLDRMERMIEQLLTMARAETSVGSTETIYLAPLVDAAWESIPSADAVFESELDDAVTVDGDRDLLLNIFENLFRNAVEHGSPSDQDRSTGDAQLRIRVGSLDGEAGVFVEDNGQGVPENERAELFEFGHTTSSSGTGFGLAIVRELVEVHGWEITVTDGETGGARFEIRTE